MNLDEWMQRDHSLAEQLVVVDGLCNAVSEDHQRGVLHRALEPANIEVLSDGRCTLQLAVRPDAATPAAARYRAPEILEGASYSPLADVYSVGVLCYEILSGHNPSGSDRPQTLSELRPEVSRELSDAIMGCLEKGADWRPRDLSFLQQVVTSLRPARAAAARPAKPAAEPPRAAVPAPSPRRAAARGSRSNVPLLLVVLVLVLAGGGGAWLWMQSQQPSAAGAAVAQLPAPTAAPPSAAAAPTPSSPPSAAAATPQPKPSVEAAKPENPEPATEPPKPRVSLSPAPTPQPTELQSTARLVEPTPAAPTPEPRTEEPATPAVLTTLSPLTLKRPITAMLDLHGLGLRPDHRAQIIRVKSPPNGIAVVRQKYVSPTLIQVVVRVDETVPPGAYALGLTDPQGMGTNSLGFTVTK